MTNNKYGRNNHDDIDSQDDLAVHGVKDIIPEDEEYYTLDLRRGFDDREDEDDGLNGIDVASSDPHNLDDLDEPPKSSSIYNDATLVQSHPDYLPRSSNQGGVVKERNILDQDNSTGYQVGDPGNIGIDEDTG